MYYGYYVRITSAKTEFVRSVQFVCHSVCVEDYCKSNRPISLNVDIMIGPNSRKNWLIFGGDAILATHSKSLFHFSQALWILGNLLAFSFSHRPIFTKLRKMTDAAKEMNPQHFGNKTANIGYIQE